jgi:hypothetical protein
MRFWILVICGVLVLAGAIWPWAKPSPQPTFPAVIINVPPPQPKSPTPEPPKAIEVIDLSRAYDPVREPEEPITPATIIEVPPEPERIDLMPRAVEPNPFGDVIERVKETPTGSFLPGVAPHVERLNVMPREVMPVADDRYKCAEMKLVTVERIAAAPRILPARFVIEQPDGRLLHYLETDSGAVVRVSGLASPADERLTQPIPTRAFTSPLIPVERLTVPPRTDLIINREERERQTGVREDDFVGQIGPQ